MKIQQYIPISVTILLAVLLTACGEDVSAGEAVGAGIGIWAIGSILAFILVVWAVIDLVQKPYPMEKKLIWGVVILVIPFLGAVLYFILGRNKQSVI
ncbi:PLD nuclease N-terminal domain-containing protein [Lewinella sp. IMCC34191]|uniref:PLD nuclease N-terminal domain-containing protein n=1 Tax=Lewinella sp. IMCC34191 TaxID=2259172 RepID=UPI001300451E|nr:PLD nuclease N-terminal domain-containing protein [Lewinella sp. IMCC34191]